MGYDVFKFGTIALDGEIQPVPQHPTVAGDIPQYDGKATISFGTLSPEEGIIWIKPDGLNLLIADRVLLAKVSWEDLDRNGFVKGKPVLIDGQRFRCRLLQTGENGFGPNEWDSILNKTGKEDTLWHWYTMYFWGADTASQNKSCRVVRGDMSARNWNLYYKAHQVASTGFRPALEPLPSAALAPNINLDGIGFQLSSLPGGDGFWPILQPTQGDIFKDFDVGAKVRMYTFMDGQRPIRIKEPIKKTTRLTLTDRYFGDEYLVPWTISNGIAVANKAFQQTS